MVKNLLAKTSHRTASAPEVGQRTTAGILENPSGLCKRSQTKAASGKFELERLGADKRVTT
jgi:hypothetical protein